MGTQLQKGRKTLQTTWHSKITFPATTWKETITPVPSTNHTTLTSKKYSNPTYWSPPLSPTLPSLATPRLFSWSHSGTRVRPSTTTSRNQQRAMSVSKEDRQGLNAIFLCSETLDSPIIDHQIKKSLTPLISPKTIDNKKISNPYLFWGVPMVTTFVCQQAN